MSLSILSKIDAAYIAYYSVMSEAELAEETQWANFSMIQFAVICSDEDSFGQVPKSGATWSFSNEDGE